MSIDKKKKKTNITEHVWNMTDINKPSDIFFISISILLLKKNRIGNENDFLCAVTKCFVWNVKCHSISREWKKKETIWENLRRI